MESGGFVVFMRDREVVRPVDDYHYPEDLRDGQLYIECCLVRKVVVRYVLSERLRPLVEEVDSFSIGLRSGPETSFAGSMAASDPGGLVFRYSVPAGHTYTPRIYIQPRHGLTVNVEPIEVPPVEIPQQVLDENGGSVPADDERWHPEPLEFESRPTLAPRR